MTILPDSNEPAARPAYSLWQLIVYMLKLGTFGFGGPVALVGYMYRDLVERRKWISEADYKEGLTLAQLMPGPLAAQLAIYLGYVHYGNLGATLVGVAFVIPSFIMVVLIGIAYVAYGGLTWMQAVFYGVGACVIGIIAISAYKLTTKSIGKATLPALANACARRRSVLSFFSASIKVDSTCGQSGDTVGVAWGAKTAIGDSGTAAAATGAAAVVVGSVTLQAVIIWLT